MNRYGMMAMEHWQNHAPRRYEALPDPEAYFTDLGEVLSHNIQAITGPKEAALPNNLTYLERLQELEAIRRQAEEIVLTELLWSVHEPSLDPELHLEQLLNQLPSIKTLDEALERLHATVAADCEAQNLPVLYDDQEQEEHLRLTRMQNLIREAEDPNRSWKDRLKAAEKATNLYSRQGM